MAEFIRECPRCGAINPEYEAVCRQCSQFIGMVTPTPRADAAPSVVPPPGDVGPAAVELPAAAPHTRRYRLEALTLRLTQGEAVFAIGDGMVLGQAHPSSQAHIQIPSRLAGSEFIHRRHCRFLFNGSEWQVVAIDQSVFGHEFTNPTFVNETLVAPGEAHPLRPADRLRLSGVEFQVELAGT